MKRLSVTTRLSVAAIRLSLVAMVATAIVEIVTITVASNSCDAADKVTGRKKGGPALRMIQRHFYWGDLETTISKAGIRLTNKGRMGFTLVSKSPDWDVTIFRNDDRTFLRRSLKRFKREGIISDFIVSRQDRLFSDGIVRKTTGKLGAVVVTTISGTRSQIQYLPIEPYAAPPVESILYTVFKQPTNGCIPVTYTKIVKKGSNWISGHPEAGTMRVQLATRAITKVTVPDDYFNPPSGYRKVTSAQEVLLSRANRDASGDFDELFEIGKGEKRRKD